MTRQPVTRSPRRAGPPAHGRWRLAGRVRRHRDRISGTPEYSFLDDAPTRSGSNPHFTHWAPLTDCSPRASSLTRPGGKPSRVSTSRPTTGTCRRRLPERRRGCASSTSRSCAIPAEARELLGMPGRAGRVHGRVAARFADWGFAAVNPRAVLGPLHYAARGQDALRGRVHARASRLASRGHRGRARRLSSRRIGIRDAPGLLCGRRTAREETCRTANIIAFDEAAARPALPAPRPAPRRDAPLVPDRRGRAVPRLCRATSRGPMPRCEREFVDLIARAWTRAAATLSTRRPVRAPITATCTSLAHRSDRGRPARRRDRPCSAERQSRPGVIVACSFRTASVTCSGCRCTMSRDWRATPRAARSREPAGHPFLRLTRRLEPGFVVTIEPGLYFIDLLLDGRASRTRAATASTGTRSIAGGRWAASASRTTCRARPARRRTSRARRLPRLTP